MFTKAQINGWMYYSMENKEVTKRNSYAVLYLNSNAVSYSIVKYNLHVNNYKLALIDSLQCLHIGPPKTFMNNIITVEKSYYLKIIQLQPNSIFLSIRYQKNFAA